MHFSVNRCCLLIVWCVAFWATSAAAEFANLPDRARPRPVTTDGIRHIQLDVEAVPEITADLLHRVSKIPGIQMSGTIVGRSGSTGFSLHDDTELVRPDSTIHGREFAHVHPDGSLHASLPPELAIKAIEGGWAVRHPWAAKKAGLERFVMLYTPRTTEELDVAFQLLLGGYEFVKSS